MLRVQGTGHGWTSRIVSVNICGTTTNLCTDLANYFLFDEKFTNMFTLQQILFCSPLTGVFINLLLTSL